MKILLQTMNRRNVNRKNDNGIVNNIFICKFFNLLEKIIHGEKREKRKQEVVV